MKIIKKAPILLLLLLVVLAILPVLNGYFAEKEIRSFFRRSPLGEKAVRSYDKGYLKSYCSVEFDALDLLKGDLDENQREQCTGVLTSVVMRSCALSIRSLTTPFTAWGSLSTYWGFMAVLTLPS